MVPPRQNVSETDNNPNDMKDTYTVKGKTGQSRKDGKKTGGQMFNLTIPGEAALELLTGIMDQSPGKLAQAMFAYGLNADAQAAVGYGIPGALPWEDGKSAPEHKWTEADTADYLAALKAYDELERENAGGPNTVELRGFCRAMQLAGMDQDKVRAMALTAKIKHADNDEVFVKVWERAKELSA